MTREELEERVAEMARSCHHSQSEDPAVRITAVREEDLTRLDPDALLNTLHAARAWIRGLDNQVLGLQQSIAALQEENAALRRRLDGGTA